MIGWSLAALVVVSLLAIGLGGLVAPRSASVQYGIVLDDPRALGFVRAMAVRDLVIGGLLGLLALARTPTTLGWAMCLTALIAVIDLLVVTADRRTRVGARIDRARALHASGVVGLLATGAALLGGW
jgi:hypothetical protein